MAAEKNLGSLSNQLPVLLLGALRPDAVGYYSAALRAVSLPYPLVTALARYLDVLLPARVGRGPRRVLDTFRQTTLFTGVVWLGVTALVWAAAPLLLVHVAGEDFRPAVAAVYPLLVQSAMVGFGVGIASAIRAVEKPQWLIALQLFSIAMSVPFAMTLIDQRGAVGAAWFHAARYVVLTGAGLALVPWLVERSGGPPEGDA